MKNILFAALLLVGISMAACKKEPVVPVGTELEQKLLGKWKLETRINEKDGLITVSTPVEYFIEFKTGGKMIVTQFVPSLNETIAHELNYTILDENTFITSNYERDIIKIDEHSFIYTTTSSYYGTNILAFKR